MCRATTTYINPLTDFGFKRLFGQEENKKAALTKAEREEYDQSLKIYRDNYAIAQTERRLGKEEGREEEKRKIVLNMLGCGLPVKDIAKFD